SGRAPVTDRALIAAGLSVLGATVHAGLAPVHPGALGVLFALAAAGETWCVVALVRGRAVERFAIVLNAAIVLGWLLSRTVGLPLLEAREPVGALDLLTTLT